MFLSRNLDEGSLLGLTPFAARLVYSTGVLGFGGCLNNCGWRRESTEESEMIFQGIKLVRQEAGKVSWPSYREALLSSAIVLSLMSIAGVALWVIDYGLGAADRLLLTF